MAAGRYHFIGYEPKTPISPKDARRERGSRGNLHLAYLVCLVQLV